MQKDINKSSQPGAEAWPIQNTNDSERMIQTTVKASKFGQNEDTSLKIRL